MRSFLVLFAVVFFVGDASGIDGCSRLYTPVGNRCLRFIPEAELLWADAQARCDIIGGHLVQLDDCNLLGDISNFIKLTGNVPRTGRYWIGGTDALNEGEFVWVSDLEEQIPLGVPFWGTEFGEREPNGYTSENCVMIVATDGYHFHDRDCDGVYAGVLCEEDVNYLTNDTYPALSCPFGYTSVANGCFLALEAAVETWDGARVTCGLNGGQLARVGDCRQLGELSVYLQGTNPSLNYWIGISDQENEGIYQYPDGTIALLTSVFWGQSDGVSEPNGGEFENCVALSEEDDYYFHDEDCSNRYAVLCEADPY